jgi:hypothetical protein
MRCFDWQRVWTKELGWIHVPIADVEVRLAPGPWRTIRVIVDSGAVLSLFKRSFGELLGLDIEEGKPIDVSGIGRGTVPTYLHTIQMNISGQTISLLAAFATTEEPPNLLGRQGIFDRFDVSFQARHKRTCFHPS